MEQAPFPSSGLAPPGKLTGIGGWLSLLTIGRIGNAFSLGYYLWIDASVRVRPRYWKAPASIVSPVVRSYRAFCLVNEFQGNLLFLLANFVILWLLFTRRRGFRPAMALYFVAILFFVWEDYFLWSLIPGIVQKPALALDGAEVRAMITALLWVPYGLVSKRVRLTFVR